MENHDMNLSSTSLSTSTASPSSSSTTTSWFSGILLGRSASVKMASKSSSAATGDSLGGGGGSGPINKKRQFRGVMFKYGPKPIQYPLVFRPCPHGFWSKSNIWWIYISCQGFDLNLMLAVAFKMGDYKQQVIFIGGLTDGFLASEYLEPLAIALEKERWSLVQFLFSSSYSGYGISSLKQDALELDQLISYLINKEDSEGVVLLGHSTGCQDIIYYMRTNAACSRAVRAAILQAPVSDREFKATLPETASMIDLASMMISEGRGSELMPWEANPDSPITAYRYHSLCAYNGDDDMFSSDFSEDQLKQKLGHMSSTPCLVIFSMADEYIPDYVDKKALVDRLCRAMGGAEKAEIEYGNHSLSNRAEEAVQAIIEFVKRDGPKGWDDPWN